MSEPSQRDQALAAAKHFDVRQSFGAWEVVRTNEGTSYPPVVICSFESETTAREVVFTLKNEYAEGYDKGVGDGLGIGLEVAEEVANKDKREDQKVRDDRRNSIANRAANMLGVRQ